MELEQFNRVGFEVLEAAFDERDQVLAVVAAGLVRIEAAAGFGGNMELFAAFFAQLRQQPFAAAIAIHIGGVEEIDATIKRPMQRSQRLLVLHATPGAADGPGTEADRRNLPTGSSKFAIFHRKRIGLIQTRI